MLKFLGRRLLYCLIVVIGVSIVVFAIIHLSPGDPVYLLVSETATEEEIEAMRTKMGFDRPLIQQYGVFVGNLLHGDLGESLFYKQPCADLIFVHLKATALLTFSGIMLALAVGIPLGILAGLKRGSVIDVVAMFFANLGQSMSPVWLGILLIFTFSVKLKLLPSFGYGTPANLVLPMCTLGLPIAALIARLTRAGTVETMSEDYILALRAKGIPSRMINFKYALKNILIPIVNVVGLRFGAFLGGAVVNETVFAWPGIGRLSVNAIMSRDYPLVQATILVVGMFFVLINMLVDMLCTIINPRLDFK